VFLVRTGDGKRFDLHIPSASQNARDFVHTLHEGEIYVFPQVILDYIKSNPTNTLSR